MELPFYTEDFGASFSHVDWSMRELWRKVNHRRIAYKCCIMHLLLPSTVTRKLLITQASYYRITKLRAHITQKCKKLNIRKCGIVPGFCRLGHNYLN